MSAVMHEHDEREREEKRREIVKLLKPGSIVRVIERYIQPQHLPSQNPKGYKLTRLSTWRRPNADGIILARDWSRRQHDADFKEAFARAKGPLILLDETALVLAVLPDLPDELSPARPWVLLMTVNSRIGWCYAIDGLELVHR